MNIVHRRKLIRAFDGGLAPLTDREIQVLNYVADGKTNKQIGYIIGVTESTVKSQVGSILRKLGANDRAHAVALAMRKGWL